MGKNKKSNRHSDKNDPNAGNKLISILLVALVAIIGLKVLDADKPSSIGISAHQQIDTAEKIEEATFKWIKENCKEEIDKVYGNGLYKEDVSEIRDDFTKKYKEYLQTRFSGVGKPMTFQVDVEFYTLTLKNARDGQLTFDEIMENPGEHIRNASLIINGFYKPSKIMRIKSNSYYSAVKELWKEYDESGVKKTEILWSIYDDSILKEESLESIESSEHQLVYLEPYKKCLYRNIITEEGLDSHKKFLDNKQEDLDIIANEVIKKYDEEFIGIIDLKDKGRTLCAPVNDMSLYFETEGTPSYEVLKDKYITLLVQKRLYEHVRKVIKEVGLEDRVVPVVIPMDYDSSQGLTRVVKKPSTMETFELVNGYFDDDTCITLHYMKLPDEEIDYVKIRDFYERVRVPFKKEVNGVGADSEPFEYKKVSIFAYFFDVESNEIQQMILRADGSEYFTEHYIDHNRRLATFMANMYETTDFSDGCLSVIIKGKKHKKIAAMNRFGYEGSSMERFIKFIMVDSVFE